MTKALRLPLLALLASLTFAFVMTPSPAAAADVSCDNQAGHFVIFTGVSGLGGMPPGQVSCNVGYQATEWDCVWDWTAQDFLVANVVGHPPVFCWGYTPYQHMVCC